MTNPTQFKNRAVAVPVTGTALTSTSGTTTVPLRTVSNGLNYALTSLEITTDAPATAPLLVQVQIAAQTVYSAYVNNLTPLRWTNAHLAVEATSGQQAQLVFGQTASVQKVAYNAGQVEA